MTAAALGVRAVVVCLVLAASTATAAAPALGTGSGVAGVGAATPENLDPDTVRLLVVVREDGTAEWRVEYRTELDDENRTEAFESLQSDVRSNPDAYAAEFRELMTPSVERAAEETGREMTVRNLSVSTSREFAPPTGVVTYEFEWTAFAATDGDRLVVGDAIHGFYVSDETVLRIEWPDGYAAETVAPEPDERTGNAVEWHGRTAFGSDEPRVELAESGPAPESGVAVDVPLSLAAAATLALVAALGLVGREWSGTVDADAGTDEAGDDREGGESPPPELLSNEERVVATLEANGGRMKQQELSEELDWGAPKTSRVVGSLREEDEVEVFRLGRENVVTLPEEELL